LSIYFDKSIRDVQCKRVGDPNDTYKMIKEEQEAGQKVSPSIKTLLKKHVNSIIFDEDEGVKSSMMQNDLGKSFKELMK
jgi:hypothetical protein